MQEENDEEELSEYRARLRGLVARQSGNVYRRRRLKTKQWNAIEHNSNLIYVYSEKSG
jgi:hypothetical protein